VVFNSVKEGEVMEEKWKTEISTVPALPGFDVVTPVWDHTDHKAGPIGLDSCPVVAWVVESHLKDAGDGDWELAWSEAKPVTLNPEYTDVSSYAVREPKGRVFHRWWVARSEQAVYS
jgi:hypothetical protein